MECQVAGCSGELGRWGRFWFCGECGAKLTLEEHDRLATRHAAARVSGPAVVTSEGPLEPVGTMGEQAGALPGQGLTLGRLRDALHEDARLALEEARAGTLTPAVHVERPRVTGALARFLTEGPLDVPHRAFLLSGRSGSGKSTLLTQVSSDLSAHALFFVQARDLADSPHGSLLFANLVRRSGLPAEEFPHLADLLRHLEAARKREPWHDPHGRPACRFVVVIDGIDEAPRPAQVLREALEWVRLAGAFPWVRIVLSMRSEALRALVHAREGHEVHALHDLTPLFVPPDGRASTWLPGEAMAWELPPLGEELAASLYRRTQAAARQDATVPACATPWEHLPEVVRRELLRVPLHQALWMRAFEGVPPVAVVAPADLFAAFLARASSRRPGLAALLRRLADGWATRGTCRLADDDLRAWQEGGEPESSREALSPVGVLVAEGILQETARSGDPGWRVPCQRMREYLVFLRLAGEDPFLGLESARTWLLGPVDPERFPEHAGASAFLFQHWVRSDRASDVAEVLALDALPDAVRVIALQVLVERLLSGGRDDGARHLDFVHRVLAGLPAGGAASTRTVRFFLSEVWGHLGEASVRQELVDLVSSMAVRLPPEEDDGALDVTQARDLAFSHSRLGDLRQAVGDLAGARACYERALACAEILCGASPEPARHQAMLAWTCARLGELHRGLGNAEPARSYHERALEIAAALHRRFPTGAWVGGDLVASTLCLGDFFLARDDAPTARSLFERALELAQDLYRRAPDSEQHGRDLASAYGRLGDAWRVEGDAMRAISYFERAVDLREDLHRRVPEGEEHAGALAESYEKLGEVHLDQGDVLGAQAYHERAVQVRESLHRQGPDHLDHAHDLATSYLRMGELCGRVKDGARARDSYERALELVDDLHRRAPDSPRFARLHGAVLGKLGEVYRGAGDNGRAREAFRRGLEIAEDLHRREPGDAEAAQHLSEWYSRMGDFCRSMGDMTRARDCYERDLEISGDLHRRLPDSAEHARDLSASYTHLADFFRSTTDAARSRYYYELAVEIGEDLHRRDPENAEGVRELMEACDKLGDLCRSVGDVARARGCYERVLEKADEAHRKNPTCVDSARRLMTSCERLGAFERVLGNVAGARTYYELAVDVAEELHRRVPSSAEHARDLAVVLVRCGELRRGAAHLDVAHQFFERAARLGPRMRDEGFHASTLLQLSLLESDLGDARGARRWCDQGLDIARRTENRLVEGILLGCLGSIAARQGQVEQSGRYYQQSLVLARELDFRPGVLRGLAGLARVFHASLRLADAWACYEEALDLGQQESLASLQLGMGLLCLHEAKAPEAREHLSLAESLHRSNLARNATSYEDLYPLALAILAGGRVDEALQAYDRALEVCPASGVIREALQGIELLACAAPALEGLGKARVRLQAVSRPLLTLVKS